MTTFCNVDCKNGQPSFNVGNPAFDHTHTHLRSEHHLHMAHAVLRPAAQRPTIPKVKLCSTEPWMLSTVRSRNDLTTCACADTCLCWRAPIRHATFVCVGANFWCSSTCHARATAVHTQTTQGQSSSAHWVGVPVQAKISDLGAVQKNRFFFLPLHDALSLGVK